MVTAASLVWLGKVSVYRSCNLVFTAQAMLLGLHLNAECPTLFRSLWIINSLWLPRNTEYSSLGCPPSCVSFYRKPLGGQGADTWPKLAGQTHLWDFHVQRGCRYSKNLLGWRGQRYPAYKGSNCGGPNGNDLCLTPRLWAVLSSQMEDTGFFTGTAVWYDSEPFELCGLQARFSDPPGNCELPCIFGYIFLLLKYCNSFCCLQPMT